MTTQQSQELKEKGYTIIRNQVSKEWLDVLSSEMDKAFAEHRNIQLYNNNDINSGGVALHILLSSPIFIEFLQTLLNNGFIQSLQDNFFHSKCILNSFSALNNLPNQPNFSAALS